MGRHAKTPGFFEDEPPIGAPDPPDVSDLADDEKAIIAGEEPTYEPDPDPTHKKKRTHGSAASRPPNKRTAIRNSDAPLRERVREYAGMSQFQRIKLYEDLIKSKTTPIGIKMECAKRLDELAMDKTGVAAPIGVERRRVLIGHTSGIRSGGDALPLVIAPRETSALSTQHSALPNA